MYILYAHVNIWTYIAWGHASFDADPWKCLYTCTHGWCYATVFFFADPVVRPGGCSRTITCIIWKYRYYHISLLFLSLIYSSSLVSHSRSLQEMTAFRKNIFPATQGGMRRLVDMAISIFSQSHWNTFVIWVWKVWSNLGTEALAVSLCLVRRLLQTDIFFSYRSCSLVFPYMGGSKIRPAKFVAAKKKQSRKQRASVKN